MKIDVFTEGNQVGVCLGSNIAEGFSGFGDDLPAALRDLARDLDSAPGEYEALGRAKLRAEVSRSSGREDGFT